MIALTAVIFVPLLYAGMFLWAFWDPYDRLDDIPVAVVNEDIPYEYEGETFELGRELVDQLKEEDAFDFHFVDRETGYNGLKEEDYYILVEIPEEFSKNATTLMDDHPEKLRLHYIPNESYNFLASQIGETAMLEIEKALEEKIIETYTETIFEKIDEVADGLQEAQEATEELDEGAQELKDNTHLLKDHLRTLAEKSIEFVEGTEKLSDGATELADGTDELSEGIGELHGASHQLLSGSKQIQSGQGELSKGIQAVQGGAEQINGHLPILINGTKQFEKGLQQFERELPKQMATEINKALEEGSTELSKGLNTLEKGIANGLGASTNNPEGLAVQLSKGLSDQISHELQQMAYSIEKVPEELATGLSTALAKELINQQVVQVKQLEESMKRVGVSENQIAVILEGIQESSPSEKELQQRLQMQIADGIKQQMPNIEEELAKKQSEVETSIEQGVFYAVGETEKQVKAGFDTFSKEMNKSLAKATDHLEGTIRKGTKPAFHLLQEGINEIATGQQTLQGGIHQLAEGTGDLNEGFQTLSVGQEEFVSNMQLFTNKFEDAKEGSEALASGSSQLVEGVHALEDGAGQFQEGAEDLAEGSEKLADGMDELKEGTEEFHEEMSEAVHEIDEVESDEETYNMMANPVEVDNKKINEVPNYGTGFAPYFISLGLYVGALLLSIVYPLRAPTITPTSGFNWFLRKTAGLGIIGVLQALLVASLLLYGLNIEVQSVPLFYLYAIFTSWTFIALIQFLVTCFDDPGRFVSIIILILQLTTSAGTFPLELIPEVLQPLNAFLPMTYSVTGFKAVISSGRFGIMWQTVGILAIFTIISLLLTLSYFLIMYKRKSPMMEEQEA